jgi:acyl dehydratase
VADGDPDLPDSVRRLLGAPLHPGGPVRADGSVGVAVRVVTGWPEDDDPTLLPASSLSAWMRPPDPGGPPPLALHGELKELLGLPSAVIVGYELELRRPVVAGEPIAHHQRLRRVGPPERTRLGTGRRWEIEVAYTDGVGRPVGRECYRAVGYAPGPAADGSAPVGAASRRPPEEGVPPVVVEVDVTEGLVRASSAAFRDWAPVHHDRASARAAGLPGLIMSTPSLAGWAERAVCEAGPVLGVELRMRAPVVAGDRLLLHLARGSVERERIVSMRVDGRERAVARVTIG